MTEQKKTSLKVKRMPVSEQVYDAMRDALKKGVWAPGEKIPTEMELSDTFGVNRMTVRMALQRLIGMGLLESRVGDGTYAKEFSLGDYMGRVSEFYLGPELLDKIREFRSTVEIACANLAMERATAEDLEELELCCERFEKEKQAYLDQFTPATCEEDEQRQYLVKLDVEFHRTICRMSHNDLFVYAFDMAKDLLYDYIDNNLKARIETWKIKKQKGIIYNDMHRLILDSIKQKDFERCKKVYADMVDYKVHV